jgi:hypothetical protein
LDTQWLVPLFGKIFEATSKNREVEGALALGGRCSINTHNNQMEVGIQGGGYIEEGVRPGGTPIIFAVKRSIENKEKKLHLGLRRPPFKILPHNNQPKTCVRA